MERKNAYIVNLNKYTISGTPIELTIRIEFSKGGAKMIVPLPKNYPPTTVGTSRIIKSKGLFIAEVFVMPLEDNDWNDYFPVHDWETARIAVREQFGIATGSHILLDKFYNIAKDENIPITHEEELMFKGLGRKFICLAFPYVISYFNLNPSSTLIFLQAKGIPFNTNIDPIKTEIDRKKLQYYLTLDMNKILTLYKEQYPEEFEINYEYLASGLEPAAHSLVLHEINQRLIQYYNATYGFQSLTHISLATIMATTVSTFLGNCNK
jgi:hypothetical protein